MNTEWSYDEYYDYINDPKVLVNPIRNVKLFDNGALELLTMTPWWLIPAVYLPLAAYHALQAPCSPAESVACFIAGLALWSFAEYSLHRFMFHCEDFFYFPRFSAFYGIHFLVHGIHHAFPQDYYRLVFPPTLGIPLLHAAIKLPCYAMVGDYYGGAVFAGAITMYVVYDMIHYWIHHLNPADGTYFKTMKVYHMQHHYKNGTLGFGVSSKFWDIIFRTEIAEAEMKKLK